MIVVDAEGGGGGGGGVLVCGAAAASAAAGLSAEARRGQLKIKQLCVFV